MSISENPMFGVMIGTAIGNNASAEAAALREQGHNEVLRYLNARSEGNLQRAIEIIGALREETNTLENEAFATDSILAGVRGVVRELLSELRNADPKNPLLNKNTRDRIYDSSKNAFQDMSKNEDGSVKDLRARNKESGQTRDAIYGAKGSSKSGPEKDQITPNAAVRAAAEVPAGHVTDRERFLALIEKLTTELKAANPDAPILQDKEMVGVFEEFASTR